MNVKKIILPILFCFSFVGCANSSLFNPPDWILGSWSISTSSLTTKYEFTESNIVNTNTGSLNLTINFDEAFGSIGAKVDEEITSTKYVVNIDGTGTTSDSGIYTFTKLTDTTLRYTVNGLTSSALVYTKE